jgi:hypothetical protein
MACPYFEPTRPLASGYPPGGRSPLIDLYEGNCCAAPQPVPAPEDRLVTCCNQGYPCGRCAYLPATETRSALRYSVVSCDAERIEILCIEEADHAPLRWHTIRYDIVSGELEPDAADACMRAQVIAFCTSFLRRCSN